MCKTYITNHKELSDLEQETLAAKFRKPSKSLHRAVFCRETRALVLAAPYNVSGRKTKQAIQGMLNLYKPSMLEVVSMPMGAV